MVENARSIVLSSMTRKRQIIIWHIVILAMIVADPFVDRLLGSIFDQNPRPIRSNFHIVWAIFLLIPFGMIVHRVLESEYEITPVAMIKLQH